MIGLARFVDALLAPRADQLEVAERDAGGSRRAGDAAVVLGENPLHVAAFELLHRAFARAWERQAEAQDLVNGISSAAIDAQTSAPAA